MCFTLDNPTANCAGVLETAGYSISGYHPSKGMRLNSPLTVPLTVQDVRSDSEISVDEPSSNATSTSNGSLVLITHTNQHSHLRSPSSLTAQTRQSVGGSTGCHQPEGDMKV